MMRFLVLSDTHCPRSPLPGDLSPLMSGMEGIIHCGDFSDYDSFLSLEAYGLPVYGVTGNNDPWELRRILPERRILLLGELKVAVTHGASCGGSAHACARREFSGQEADLILFGHSHLPEAHPRPDPPAYNPGSFSQGRGRGNTIGILEIEGRNHLFRHFLVNSRSGDIIGEIFPGRKEEER